jgi:AcrR family transcriptional regulator
LAEQPRTAKELRDRRSYRMSRRAVLVDQTRQRITEAAMRLHTTIGPSQASIAAIAEEAGVTRLTVYRHFRDPDELFGACMGHWMTLHPAPDPTTWAAISDLEARARHALAEVYGWYEGVGEQLHPIYRDIAGIPPHTRAVMDGRSQAMAEGLVGKDGPSGERGRLLRGVAGHLVALGTWRSLTVEQRLTTQEAVSLGVDWLVAVALAAR